MSVEVSVTPDHLGRDDRGGGRQHRQPARGLGAGRAPSEAETFWTEFLRGLARRGLRGVKLVVSDAHEGLTGAAARVLNATWQRCRVHFMRNEASNPSMCLRLPSRARTNPTHRRGRGSPLTVTDYCRVVLPVR